MRSAYARAVPSAAEITRHHEWDPPVGEEIWVGGEPASAPIVVVDPDPSWPEAYAAVVRRVRRALGGLVLELDHVGSTSVPGLSAKAVIDVDLTVADSADEDAYVGALEGAGFRLIIRERGWHEHRMLLGDDPRSHLHVFSPGCPEVIRHRMFRDWLATHPDDLAMYERVKLDAATAATAAGESGMDYNRRKQLVIREIYDRMFRAQGLI